MNIVVVGVIAFEQPRGIGRYLNDLLPALADIDKENEYYVIYGRWMTNYSFLKIDQSNFHFIELNIKNNQITRNLYVSFMLPKLCRKYNPDIFFFPDTQAIINKPGIVVSTIHDLAEYSFPQKYNTLQRLFRRLIVKHQATISSHIITDSMFSKKDILQRFDVAESKISVVYLATEMNCNYETIEPQKYFLFVSETERAKNLMLLIEAFAALPCSVRDEFEIRVVGKKGNDYDNILMRIKELGIEGNVIFYGYVSENDLLKLYKEAYAFVFPSFFEGFGFPVLEAMTQGVPVMCSNKSSIPEVGGNAVICFDPYDQNDLKEKLLQIIDDIELRNEMVRLGFERVKAFSYERTATETLEIMKDVYIRF